MSQQKYNYRFFLKPNGRVFLRVRWNAGKNETSIGLCVYADPAKWDSQRQRAKIQSIHEIHDLVYTARTINNEIDKATDVLATYFALCDAKAECPSKEQLKEELATKLVRRIVEVEEQSKQHAVETPSIKALYEQFVIDQSKERNWAPNTHYKYQQIVRLMLAYRHDLTVDQIDKKFCNELKCWLVEQGYKNSTTTKLFRNLKAFLGWVQSQGHPIADSCFAFKTNLAVPVKTVIYLKLEEVLQFENYQFPSNRQYLAKARDLFCFMCYTSLRFSDLRDLKKAAISDNCIDMYAQKTKGRLRIPLVSYAQRILEKYIHTTPGEYAFPVPTNPKMNQFLKEAAEMAGLNREIVETTFCGSKRLEKVCKLHESISCHDARRTFVCISLNLGIPQNVVMTMTGHADYETMKPYISISDETSKLELIKWEVGSVRNKLGKMLDSMSEQQLKLVVKYATKIINSHP